MITCYRIENIYDHEGIMNSSKIPWNTKWYKTVVARHDNFPGAKREFPEMTEMHKCAFNSLEDLNKFVTKRELKAFSSKRYGFRLFKLEVNGLQKCQTIFKEYDAITKVDITNQYLTNTEP